MIGWYIGADIGPIAQTQTGTDTGKLPFIRNQIFALGMSRVEDPALTRVRSTTAALQKLRSADFLLDR